MVNCALQNSNSTNQSDDFLEIWHLQYGHIQKRSEKYLQLTMPNRRVSKVTGLISTCNAQNLRGNTCKKQMSYSTL